ncbi:uncharacterized protein LOC121689814 isoform X2 [Alosa sapidissima]|nr:uncharacterized protein LOC121689814 isoform X2 [Alosa sapidissima]
MLVIVVLILHLRVITSSLKDEVCGNNKVCELAFRAKTTLTGNNDTCWVCQDKSFQVRVFPYRTLQDSVCAAARLCTSPKCLSEVGLENIEKFLHGSSLNVMLTLMDSVWLNETGEWSKRKLGWINSEANAKYKDYWPVSITKGQAIPQAAKPYTVCNNSGFPLRVSGWNLETMQVPATKGFVCLSVRSSGKDKMIRKQLGHSKCQYYLKANYDQLNSADSQSEHGIWLGGNYFPLIRYSSVPSPNFNFALPMGMYWVCGKMAYSYWPPNAVGTCYIAAIAPTMWILHGKYSNQNQSTRFTHREKREMTYTSGGMSNWKGYVIADPWTGQGATVGWTFSL